MTTTIKKKLAEISNMENLDIYIKDESPIVRAAVADMKYGLEILKYDPEPSVRSTVASNYTGDLDIFLNDPDPLVRLSVAFRDYKLDKLLNDSDYIIRNVAKDRKFKIEKKYSTYNHDNEEYIENIVGHLYFIDPESEVYTNRGDIKMAKELFKGKLHCVTYDNKGNIIPIIESEMDYSERKALSESGDNRYNISFSCAFTTNKIIVVFPEFWHMSENAKLFVLCHEIAHIMGFDSEEGANEVARALCGKSANQLAINDTLNIKKSLS